MNPYSDDFELGLPADEREALEALAHRLVVERPRPNPMFRGELGRRLVATSTRTRQLRLRAAACLVSGALLLVVAGLGVIDAGPLAPGHAGAQIAQIRNR